MPRFFAAKENFDPISGSVTLTGDDAHHIARSLRMAEGDGIVLCDGEGTDYDCRLDRIRDDAVTCSILASRRSASEPPYRVTLYQALVKGERMDAAVQKSVEFGVFRIVPFESSRCVVRSREDGGGNKLTRLRRIAAEAAKQSGRGIVPTVTEPLSFDSMLRAASAADLPLFCYENERTRQLGTLLADFRAQRTGAEEPTVSVIIGPEGGFSPEEAERAASAGIQPVSLGHRILRTESAAPFVLAALSAFVELC